MIWVNGVTEIEQLGGDLLDYQFDFQFFLALDADTITSATAVSSGVNAIVSNVSNTTTTVTFWLALIGSGDDVTVQVTTALGRNLERCVQTSLITC